MHGTVSKKSSSSGCVVLLWTVSRGVKVLTSPIQIGICLCEAFIGKCLWFIKLNQLFSLRTWQYLCQHICQACILSFKWDPTNIDGTSPSGVVLCNTITLFLQRKVQLTCIRYQCPISVWLLVPVSQSRRLQTKRNRCLKAEYTHNSFLVNIRIWSPSIYLLTTNPRWNGSWFKDENITSKPWLWSSTIEELRNNSCQKSISTIQDGRFVQQASSFLESQLMLEWATKGL